MKRIHRASSSANLEGRAAHVSILQANGHRHQAPRRVCTWMNQHRRWLSGPEVAFRQPSRATLRIAYSLGRNRLLE